MVFDGLVLILALLFTVSMLAMAGQKMGIPYPIFLVIAGLIICIIPGIPLLSLKPDLVFFIFLPPLLYAAAWNTAWHDFWRLRRPIALLSIGLVFFTSCIIALVSNALIPEFPLAFGFLLGGIISPPDAVAANSVIGKMPVPKRVVSILEGESLINDASSLIVFRFAIAAIITGQFHLGEATKTFFIVGVMGIAIGLGIALIVYLIHRFFPTTPAIDAAVSLITPYVMYLTAEHFHFSGVLASVSGGLFLGYRSQEIFSYDSRIQLNGLWDTFVFLLNGFVFILIGLQLPTIIEDLGGFSFSQALFYAIVISVITILVRIIWVFPGTYLPRILSKKIREKEERPGWKPVFLVAWSGMRGVVSLAAALSIPLMIGDEDFPFRNLILFITFVVILITLVFQGLTLKPIIKWLKLDQQSDKKEKLNDIAIRVQLAESVLAYMDSNYESDVSNINAFARVKERYERMAAIGKKQLKEEEPDNDASFLPRYRQMLVELVEVRRNVLMQFRQQDEYSDELLREKEWELDLEEARLKGRNNED